MPLVIREDSIEPGSRARAAKIAAYVKKRHTVGIAALQIICGEMSITPATSPAASSRGLRRPPSPSAFRA
jgi:hypothetical protein